jgi:hypothetical protein
MNYNWICTPICTKILFLQKVGVTSAIARLATGPHSALGVCVRATIGVHAIAAIGVRNGACDGSGAPPEW